MNLNRFYYLVSALMIFAGAFMYLSPSLISPDLIYPVRVDSVYARLYSDPVRENPGNEDERDTEWTFFTPMSFGLPYDTLRVISDDGIALDGWFVAAADTPANTLLILHDLNESRISLLDHIKQFHDRGLNVCVFDLRAHGTSGGNEFSLGLPSVRDVIRITDRILSIPGTHYLVLMGMGSGAAIAMQAAVYDGRYKVLILQSPFNRLDTYLARYAYKKWGSMTFLWEEILRRKIERLLEFPVSELDLTRLAKEVKTPTLFITGSQDALVFPTEVLAIQDSSVAIQKQLLLIRNAGRNDLEENAGEQYYNRITEFINSALPKKSKTSRYKRMAVL
ncbi:MAG: alpha/beta hydrolase [Bacteroidia bacterium]|nr:alpha/beta hydrolase [Bacteroidia bacterium]